MHWLLELLILAATISELGMFVFSKTAKYCTRDIAMHLYTCYSVFTDPTHPLAVAFTGCYQGSVQLIGGSSYYGIVRVCIGGEWGTVCNSGWDNNDAAVVCRQLGYSPYGASK